MATKQVEMAVRDPANCTRFVTELVDVEVVVVNVRNRDLARTGGHVFTDVISGGVQFAPGETKSLEISEAEANRIRSRPDGAWEIVA